MPTVTAAEARDLIADGALLVDVRERDEWDSERIPGAEFKPLSTVNDWYQDLPRDRTIVIQCASGARSAQLVSALIDQAGFTDVVNLHGGLIGWKFAGFDVE